MATSGTETRITSYEEACASHEWRVPERYNIAADVCDKHPRDKLAMVWEDFRGDERRVSWGELQSLVRPRRQRPARPRGGARRPGRRGRSGDAGDGGGLLRHLEAGGDPALDVGALRRRGHPAPDLGLPGEADRLLPRPGRAHARRPGRGGGVARRELLAGADDQADTVDTAADDPAQLYYSSGTTGLAKGILHAHRYILAHEEFVYCHDVRDGELFHGMGEWAWAAGIAPLLGPWRLGATQFVYVREGGFDPAKQLEVLSRHGVTNVFTTPTAMRAMMAIGDAGERYPQKFRIVCSAGEPLNPEAIRWFREQYGLTVLDYYGLTESYPLCANYPFMEVREGSMGKPMPGWDVQILDEDEQPVAQGERGEICLRARSNPHYPLGYWNNPEASEETFGGEWFHTKDAAQQDEDGYFWYAGRADDVIISAGYRIGPFEVESACIEHPAVLEAAAVASPDPKRGHVVKAFVVLAEGHEPSDELAGEIKTLRPRPPLGLRLPAQDRVRRRPAEDADRQDPAHRAAGEGARGRRLVVRRVGELRLVAAAAVEIEVERRIVDGQRLGVDLATRLIVAGDHAGNGLLVGRRAPERGP